MAISDRINSIATHIEDTYDTFDLSNTTIDFNKNIENIPKGIRKSYLDIMNNGIDVVWNNWEKVIGEGTELTLNNTLEAKMKIDLKGNTYQYSTTGKQLFNINDTYYKRLSSGTITINGSEITIQNGSDTTHQFLWWNIPVVIGETYTISYENIIESVSNSNNRVNYLFSNTPYTTFTSVDDFVRIDKTNKYVTLTATQNYLVIGLRIYNSSTCTFSKIQLEQNNQPTSWEEYTGNQPSPSPSYPQDIQVVSGDNTIKVEGKNLLDLSTITSGTISEVDYSNDNGTITLNGTANGNYLITSHSSSTGMLLQAGTYTLSANNSVAESNNTYIRLSTLNGTAISGTVVYLETANNKATFTLTSDTKVRFQIRIGNSITYDNFVIKPQLEKSNQPTTYTPYVSQSYPINLPEGMELCKIGDYQDKIFKTSGKNLWGGFASDVPRNAQSVDFVNKADGTITVNGTSTGNAYSLNSTMALENNHYITLQAGTYTLSGANAKCRINLVDMNGNYIANTSTTTYNETFTITEATQCFARIQVSSGVSVSNETIYPMLVKGEIPLPYEPYGTGNWYKYGAIGKVVLDGSETWNYSNSVFYANVFTNKKNETINCYSNYYKYFGNASGTSSLTTNYNFATQVGQKDRILIRNEDYTTVADFQTWLSTHNTIVYYILENPTYTEITDTTLLSQLNALEKAKSYNQQTNISQVNNDLASVLNATALKEM